MARKKDDAPVAKETSYPLIIGKMACPKTGETIWLGTCQGCGNRKGMGPFVTALCNQVDASEVFRKYYAGSPTRLAPTEENYRVWRRAVMERKTRLGFLDWLESQ